MADSRPGAGNTEDEPGAPWMPESKEVSKQKAIPQQCAYVKGTQETTGEVPKSQTWQDPANTDHSPYKPPNKEIPRQD